MRTHILETCALAVILVAFWLFFHWMNAPIPVKIIGTVEPAQSFWNGHSGRTVVERVDDHERVIVGGYSWGTTGEVIVLARGRLYN